MPSLPSLLCTPRACTRPLLKRPRPPLIEQELPCSQPRQSNQKSPVVHSCSTRGRRRSPAFRHQPGGGTFGGKGLGSTSRQKPTVLSDRKKPPLKLRNAEARKKRARAHRPYSVCLEQGSDVSLTVRACEAFCFDCQSA